MESWGFASVRLCKFLVLKHYGKIMEKREKYPFTQAGVTCSFRRNSAFSILFLLQDPFP